MNSVLLYKFSIICLALIGTSLPTTPRETKPQHDEKDQEGVAEKSDETKKKVEHNSMPKALNDFTRHKEEKERKEQHQKGVETEDGDWGKAQDENEDEDETSEQISKEEVPSTKTTTAEEKFPHSTAVVTEETFPIISNRISEISETSNKEFTQVIKHCGGTRYSISGRVH